MNQLPPSPIELNQTEDEEIRLSIEEPSRRGGQSIFERLVSHLPLPKNKWDYTPLFKQQQTIRPIVSSWKRIVFVSLPLFVLIFFGCIHIINSAIGLVPLIKFRSPEPYSPAWDKPIPESESRYHYPTDFTRDIVPIPCHSHNDYWRRIPLFDAIHYGCTGVEADVWFFEDELYVGHDTASLHPNRTLRSLYVNPLLNILERQNPHTHFGNSTGNGVFDTDPDQTVVLLIDFKNDPHDIWRALQTQLKPLRAKNWLTHNKDITPVNGPITIVATGSADFNDLTENSHKDIYFDAPLEKLESSANRMNDTAPAIAEAHGVDAMPFYNSSNSFYASVSFWSAIGTVWWGELSPKQADLVRAYISNAHRLGLKVRFWDTPAWPITVRNHVWKILVREGADYLNVDDLRGATRLDWQ